MSIFLLILQIIGIVLLSIIGLILLVVGLVLFVPIRYRADGDYHEQLIASGKISWLLHLITVSVSYHESGLDTVIRILGIKYKKRPDKPKKQSRRTKSSKADQDHSAGKSTEEESLIPSETDYTLEGFEEEVTYEADATETAEPDEAESEGELGSGRFFDKVRVFATRMYDIAIHFRTKVKRFGKKIQSAVNHLEYYLNLLSDEKVQNTLLGALALVLKAVKRILPKRIKGRVHFGLAESDTMGKALAILGVLYPLYYGKIEIEPDYEQAIMEGMLMVKGRIFVISLVITAWKLYFNKDLRKVIAAFKKEVQK